MSRPKMMYAVFLEDGRWGRTLNKAKAIKCAKDHDGEVRAIPYDRQAYDAPTFLALGEVIYQQ